MILIIELRLSNDRVIDFAKKICNLTNIAVYGNFKTKMSQIIERKPGNKIQYLNIFTYINHVSQIALIDHDHLL